MPRPLFLSVLFLLAMAAAFLPPRSKYAGLNILSQLNIPTEMPGWRSMDISSRINLNDDRYNFISQVFARVYQNTYGEEIVFLVLDAGNFHNPKVCYTTSGYTAKEIDGVALNVNHRTIKVNMLDMQKPDRGIFLFYWMCMDRNIKDWTGQKIMELKAALLNRKKAGLMMRLEISSKARMPQQAIGIADEFIQALYQKMSAEQREYLFGQ